MTPIGLTFKHNGFDKYGRERRGDVMLVHFCAGCGTVNINRIAGDDSCLELLEVFKRSHAMTENQKQVLEKAGIHLVQPDEADQLHVALYGKPLSG